MNSEKLVHKERAFFQKIDGRQVAVRGYCVDALLKHLEDHNDNHGHCHKHHTIDRECKDCVRATESRWCNPSCLAKLFDGRDSKENRQKARTRFSSGYTRLLVRYNKLLLKEYEQHGGYLTKAKLYDPSLPEDQMYASRQFKEAVEKGDEKASRLEKFARIIGTDFGPETPNSPPSVEASL